MDVLLLTQPGCTACKQTAELLIRLADEYPLALVSLDLSLPEGQAQAERGGVLFPPAVFLDDEAVGYGRLSERKLRREIERRLYPGDDRTMWSGTITRLRQGIGRRLQVVRMVRHDESDL